MYSRRRRQAKMWRGLSLNSPKECSNRAKRAREQRRERQQDPQELAAAQRQPHPATHSEGSSTLARRKDRNQADAARNATSCQPTPSFHPIAALLPPLPHAVPCPSLPLQPPAAVPSLPSSPACQHMRCCCCGGRRWTLLTARYCPNASLRPREPLHSQRGSCLHLSPPLRRARALSRTLFAGATSRLFCTIRCTVQTHAPNHVLPFFKKCHLLCDSDEL